MRKYIVGKKILYTHNHPLFILELHRVIVHSDFKLLRCVVRCGFLVVVVVAVVVRFIIVIVIVFISAATATVVFFTATPVVMIAVVVVMYAVAVDALDVDFWEVIWQIPGLNKHV